MSASKELVSLGQAMNAASNFQGTLNPDSD